MKKFINKYNETLNKLRGNKNTGFRNNIPFNISTFHYLDDSGSGYGNIYENFKIDKKKLTI